MSAVARRAEGVIRRLRATGTMNVLFCAKPIEVGNADD